MGGRERVWLARVPMDFGWMPLSGRGQFSHFSHFSSPHGKADVFPPSGEMASGMYRGCTRRI